MNVFAKIILTLCVILTLSDCKKNQTGGKGSVKGVVEHHGKPIADAYVYIKFNTTEFPGDDYTKYDSYVQADAKGNFSISFYKGNYYLYSKGYDLDIPYPFTVKGGLSVTLNNKENLTKNISVSED